MKTKKKLIKNKKINLAVQGAHQIPKKYVNKYKCI